MKPHFRIQRLIDNRWVDVTSDTFARAKDAYPVAMTYWRDSGILIRESAYAREYKRAAMRIVKTGSNRAVHSFGPLGMEYKR